MIRWLRNKLRYRRLLKEASNPDCLHCVLAPVIARFLEEHPDMRPREVHNSLLQVLAEYVASTHSHGQFNFTIEVLTRLQRIHDERVDRELRQAGLR